MQIEPDYCSAASTADHRSSGCTAKIEKRTVAMTRRRPGRASQCGRRFLFHAMQTRAQHPCKILEADINQQLLTDLRLLQVLAFECLRLSDPTALGCSEIHVVVVVGPVPPTRKAHLSELQLVARLELRLLLWCLLAARLVASCCCRDSTLSDMDPGEGWPSVLLRNRR